MANSLISNIKKLRVVGYSLSLGLLRINLASVAA